MQESLVKAFKSADSFRGTDPRPWLMAIVRNQAISFLTRRKTEAIRAMANVAEPIDSSPDPEARAALTRREEEVRAAISRLPDEFREALLLREMEGMAYKEISYVLKIPIGTVMSRLSRARALLVTELVERKEASR